MDDTNTSTSKLTLKERLTNYIAGIQPITWGTVIATAATGAGTYGILAALTVPSPVAAPIGILSSLAIITPREIRRKAIGIGLAFGAAMAVNAIGAVYSAGSPQSEITKASVATWEAMTGHQAPVIAVPAPAAPSQSVASCSASVGAQAAPSIRGMARAISSDTIAINGTVVKLAHIVGLRGEELTKDDTDGNLYSADMHWMRYNISSGETTCTNLKDAGNSKKIADCSTADGTNLASKMVNVGWATTPPGDNTYEAEQTAAYNYRSAESPDTIGSGKWERPIDK